MKLLLAFLFVFISCKTSFSPPHNILEDYSIYPTQINLIRYQRFFTTEVFQTEKDGVKVTIDYQVDSIFHTL